MVEDPRAALLARGRPGDGLVEQPPHRAAAAGGDPEPLLGEPGALQLVAAADAADHVGLADLDVGEADRRVAVRVVVGEAPGRRSISIPARSASTTNRVGSRSPPSITFAITT